MRSITEWLESEETGLPFSHCVACLIPLAELAAPWLVNKEYHHAECVLEYAICQGCRDKITEQLCEESKESVRLFLEREIDWEARMTECMLSHSPTGRFDFCIACRTKRENVDGFGVSALFAADGNLVLQALPLLICRACIGKMTAGLSDQSRGVWKKFLGDHFKGPPDDSAFPGLI